MKFCSHCGKEIMDEAIICPGCGCSTEYKRPKKIRKENGESWSYNYTPLIFAAISFIWSCIFVIQLIVFNLGKGSGLLSFASLAYTLSAGCFSWISIAMSINNAFNRKYDKLIDTLSISISSIAIIVNIIIALS